MILIINALLDLWDPYDIYVFPSDEYTSYAIKIGQFIKEHKAISSDMLRDFVFSILPPINEVEVLSKIEYDRFSKALLLILEQ